MEGPAVGALILVALFTMIFGLGYLRNRESMAMIERGMDPRRYRPRAAPYQTLKWGLLLIGAGLGLFLALVLDRTLFSSTEGENPAIYFSMIAIFGGLGLFISYLIEKKETLRHEPSLTEELV